MSPARRDWHAAWPEAAIALGITLVVGLASQRWAGLDTPDSSFYLSLALNGDQVTDRAVVDSYFWSRLGQIAPTMALTTVLGPWAGFAAYRLALLLLVVAGAYATVRRFVGRAPAAVLTSMIALSTVVLSYLGNPYLTGSVLAGTSVLIALAQSGRRWAAVAAGVTLGWLAMVNPGGVILAGIVWLAVRTLSLLPTPAPDGERPGWRGWLAHLAIAAAATVATFAAFLGLGRLMFPGLDWFATNAAAAGIRLSDFASTTPVWLQDISLLVPAMIAVVTVVNLARNRGETAARLAATVSLSSIAALVLVSWVMGGIALEAPMYQAMLWPPALIAAATATAGAMTRSPWTRAADVTAAFAVAAVFLAGHWPGAMPLAAGAALAVLCAVAMLTGLRAGRTRQSAATAVAALGILLVGAQFLQNSRGPLGLYYLSPYNWAFNDNPISDKVHTAVNAQDWLLANTTTDDRIASWVGADWAGGDRELYVVAGMQLWGPNLVTLAPTLDDAGRATLDELRPTALNLVAPSMDQVIAFWQSIPADLRATAPTCYDFTWSVDPGVGHSCLTRLNWSQP